MSANRPSLPDPGDCFDSLYRGLVLPNSVVSDVVDWAGKKLKEHGGEASELVPVALIAMLALEVKEARAATR